MTGFLSPGQPQPRKTLSGLALGSAIGMATWAFYGAVIGVGTMFLVGAIARIFIARGYVPYHTTFLEDVAFLAGWLSLIFGMFGLFAGAAIGARVGRRGDPGEPSRRTVLRGTQRTLLLTLMTLMTLGNLPTTGNIPLDATPNLDDDLEVTAGWTAWGVIFLMITAFVLVPTSVPVLYQAREMQAIEAVVKRTIQGYNIVWLDVTYLDKHGTEHHGSFDREGSPPPRINVGDRVRIQPHREYGFETGAQIILDGESPDEMHSPNWARFNAGLLGGVLILPWACFFFNRAVRRP